MEANRSFAAPLPMKGDFGPIDLARAAPFALGGVEARPATREISAAGASEVLQPRIMQVLVALGTRAGEVVSRDELIQLCWDGQVVGDDAINRCIAKLRQLGKTHGAFEIVTIARVGYRLDERGAQGVGTPKSEATPVLAVLPFENLSSDLEMQFFSDGVSEEILSAVARIASVRVVASTSSFSFRGARKAEAARTLGATHVLDGSVRRGGSQVRIAAQLSDAATGQVLWNQHYDREITDVLALQDEIAALTADALSTRLALRAPAPPIDPQAYDLYLRALTARRSHDPKSQERAISYLQAAQAIEPGFVRAQAALALSLCTRILTATLISAPPEAYDAAVEEVRTAADRALRLDPNDAEARMTMLSLQPLIHAWADHEAAVEAALAAAPNEDYLLEPRARLLFGVGRTREAYALYGRVFASDPLAPRSVAYEGLRRSSMLGEDSTGRELVDRAFAMAPTDPIVWRLRSVVLTVTGAWDEALAMVASGVDAGQTAERMEFTRRGFEYYRRRGARLDNPILQHGPVMMRRSPFVVGPVVFSMVVVNDFYDEVLELLDEAMAIHPAHKLWSQWSVEALNMGPTVTFFAGRAAGFRAHPRFLPLCAKLGICRYWAETGKWPDFIVDAPNRGELEAQVRELAAGAA